MAIIVWLSCRHMPFYRREHQYEHRYHIHRSPFPGGKGRDHSRRAAAGDQRPQDRGRVGLPVLRLRSGDGAAPCAGWSRPHSHHPQGGGAGSGSEFPHLPDGRDAPVRQPLPVLLRGSDAAQYAAVPVYQGRRRTAQLSAGQLYHADQSLGTGGPADHRPAHQSRSGHWSISRPSARRASS